MKEEIELWKDIEKRIMEKISSHTEVNRDEYVRELITTLYVLLSSKDDTEMLVRLEDLIASSMVYLAVVTLGHKGER